MADDAQIIRIVVDASKAREGADEVKAHLSGIEEAARKVGEGVESFGKSFESLKTLAEGFIGVKIVEKLYEMWKGAAESALALEKLSQTIGVNTTFLQAAQFAAGQVGIRQDEMTRSFTRFTQTIGSAAQGNKQAIDSFQNLGVYLLDAQGKLRPTEVVLSDVAAAMLKIEDPAKRVEAAVQLFGKQGAAIIPMLGDLAMGSDLLATKAQKAGAVIGEEVFAQLKKMEAASESASMRWNALVLNIGTPIKTAAMEAVNRILGDILANLDRMDARRKLSEQGVIPDQDRTAVTENYNRWSELAGKKENRNNAFIQSKYDRARQAFENMTATAGSINNVPDPAEREAILREQNATQLMVSGTFPPTEPPAPGGVSNPTDKAGGESLERRLAKLMADAHIALDGAKAMADAAGQGGEALGLLETHTKDLQQIADAYIRTGQNVKLVVDAQTGALTTNNATVNAQVKALDDLNNQTRIQNALRDLGVKAFNLREQNDETQLQLQLQGQTTIEIERQVAVHKELADAKAKGIPLDSQQLQAVLAATDQQYRLKQALDDTAKSTQLWLAPFSSALNGVQSGFEALFEGILKGSKNVWQTLADTMKSIFIKLFAELAVIAVVRPIIAPIVQSIFSPGAAQQLGFSPGIGGGGGLAQIFGGGGGLSPGVQGGSGLGGGMGGGGLGSLFGGGSGPGWFSGISDWFARPVSSLFGASATPAGGFANVGDLIASGQTSASAAATGGLSIGSALGGLGSIGMGAYGLMKGGGSTASTIGSIGQIAGGVMMMVPGLQPFGAALSMLSGIVPGLFGDSGPKIPPQPALDYGSGSFSFDPVTGHYSTGSDSMNGGTGLDKTAGTIAQKVLDLIDLAGGTPVAGKLYGGTVAAGTDHTLNGQQWQNRPYTQANYTAPDGTVTRISYNDSSMNLQQQAEKLIGAVFQQDVLNGGVAGAISETLKKVLGTAAPATTQEAQTDISMSKLYDKILAGNDPTLTNAEQAFAKIKTDLQSITDWAASSGLDTSPVMAAERQQLEKVGTDFMKGINQGILGLNDPLQAQLNALADQRDAAMKEAQSIADTLGASFVDMAQVSKLYADQAMQLTQNFWASAVSSLEQAVQQLSYGALSGASPTTAFGGAKGTYLATLAQARAGDATAINRLASDATAYVSAGQSFYGNSQQFADLVAQVREALAAEQATLQSGGPGATPQASNDASNAVLSSNAALNGTIQQQQEQITQLLSQVANLTALVGRLVANNASGTRAA